MPTYTYRCKECEYQFDKRQSFTDDALKECPSCGAPTGLRKVVNSVGIVFKGSGFYVTDNKNGKNPTNGSSVNKTESKSDSDSTKSDATAKSEGQSSSEKSSSVKEKSSA